MNSKRILVLVSIAIIAILTIIASERLSSKKPSEQTLKFFNDKIGAFVIKDASGSITLHKKGDIWVVSPGVATNVNSTTKNFATDSASVAVALEKLSSMKRSDIISENREKQSIFEVDSAKGLYLEAFDNNGNSKGSVIIGKSGPDWNSNYVRSANSNKVYTVEGGVRYSFFTELNRWRDKLMIAFNSASVKNISIIKKDTAITITKADTGKGWNIVSPIQGSAKADQIDGLLSALSHFSAADFQDSVLNDSVTGLLKPQLTISIGLANGSKKISIGSKRADGKYYAVVEGKENLYLINDNDFTNFNKDLNSLKVEVPKEEKTAAAPNTQAKRN